jgi:RNA polymerase sigma-70 factor (ECF subfamily)
MADNDRALLIASGEGDTHAFDALVAAHAVAVHRFAYSLGMRGHDLDEVLQDTFISAWRAAATYRGDGTVRSWFLSIARNAVRQLRRRQHGEQQHWAPVEMAESMESMADRAGWGRTDGGTAGDAREVVLLALAQLDRDDREILMLREIEEFSGEETAHALGISMPAMKSRLHRARLKLAAAVRTIERDRSVVTTEVVDA